MFWVHNLNGQYSEALHDLALAIDYLGAALSSAEYFAEETHADTERGKHESYLAHDLIGRISPYVLIEDPETMRIKPLPRTRPPIFDVAPSEAVETFRSLRDSDNREVDWKQVARDCEILGRHWGVCLGYEDFVVNETVTDSEGAERVWSHLWALNQGWAKAELEPNDLRDYLRDERRERADEQAEKRLKTYFFTGDRWSTLPDLARKSLVDADREWFSIGRGRLESVLNDLRVASDTLCYDFLWEPVGRSKGGVGLLRFVEKCKELDIDRKEPGISEYIWLLGQPFFKEFASKADLTTQETAFLTIELKKALEDLRHQRNIAEHERKRDWKLHEVQDHLRKFMGIGCLGILPRLVDIGLKLKPGKPV